MSDLATQDFTYCNHKGVSVWISRWVWWCINCGHTRVVGLLLGNHPFRRGDLVLDEVVERAGGDRSVRIPLSQDIRLYKALMTKVYLAHPVPLKEVGDALQVELERAGFEVFNPFQRNVKEHPRSYVCTKEESKGIVEGDLALIDAVDGMVAILMGDQSIGTLMEIFYCAHVQKKPVFCLVKEDWKATHPWIQYYTKVYRNLDDLKKGLQAWVIATQK